MVEIHSFMGLSNYYHRFVEGFDDISSYLTQLTQKEVPFKWNDKFEEEFQKLKIVLTFALVLTLLV